MKFTYEYRTSDNVRHSGIIDASDREAAFAALKSRGIRPGCVAEAPGFFNKLFGKGKRWMVIAALSVVVVIFAVVGVSLKSELEETAFTFDNTTRRQLLGDAAVIELGTKSGWSDVFAEKGERYLAGFAIPGVAVGRSAVSAADVEASLSRKIAASENDSIEVRQIKAMVEGIKDELREYLSDGGKVEGFMTRLAQRQSDEVRYFQRASREVESAKAQKRPDSQVMDLWKRRNDELRLMGIMPIPMPK